MAKTVEEIRLERQADYQRRRETEKDLYTAIGRALTTWGSVENALCHVYCELIRSDNWDYAEKSFWAVQSLIGKLTMTDRVLKARFPEPPPTLEGWKLIYKNMLTQNNARNEIAHGTVLEMPYSTKKSPAQKIEVFFAPYFWANVRELLNETVVTAGGHSDPRPKNRLYVEDIETRRAKFKALEGHLRVAAMHINTISRATI